MERGEIGVPAIVDIPAAASSATELTAPASAVAIALLYVGAAIHFTRSDKSGSNIGADTGRGYIDAGSQTELPLKAGMVFAFRAASGSAVTDGFSYAWVTGTEK